MIVGLLSLYREGRLAEQAIASALAATDRVLIAEGPVGFTADELLRVKHKQIKESGEPTNMRPFTKEQRIFQWTGEWASDAAKRTAILERAKGMPAVGDGPLWGVWVDGDEVLMHPEMLRAWLDATPPDALNWPMRIVELNGACGKAHWRCIRLDMVRAYVQSSYQVELETGMVVALPNPPEYIPPWAIEDWNKTHPGQPLPAGRPPTSGEPHIVHRSGLRLREGRLHDAEAAWYPEALKAQGLEGVG